MVLSLHVTHMASVTQKKVYQNPMVQKREFWNYMYSVKLEKLYITARKAYPVSLRMCLHNYKVFVDNSNNSSQVNHTR